MLHLRLGVVFGLLLIAGCDSAGIDPVPYDGVLVVSAESVEGMVVLRLVTEDIPGCDIPMMVEAKTAGSEVGIDVLGLEPVVGVTCLALIPSSWSVGLPGAVDRLDVEIRHRGETDRYTVHHTRGGPFLEAVRTSVTRPAE